LKAPEPASPAAYARKLPGNAGRKDVALEVVEDLGHDEAFRVTRDKGRLVELPAIGSSLPPPGHLRQQP
jgi:hypothetical protein